MHIAWGPFLLSLIVIIVVPGPDFVLVSRHAAMGRKWGWLTAAGVSTGLAIYGIAAALGLSALVAAVPAMFTALKVCGVGYLVYLGLRTAWRAGRGEGPDADEHTTQAQPAGSPRTVYLRALMCDLLNPKVMITFLTLLPQAMDPNANPTAQAILLSTVIVLGFSSWWIVVVPMVGQLARLLKRPGVRRVFERTCGAALVTMAAAIALE